MIDMKLSELFGGESVSLLVDGGYYWIILKHEARGGWCVGRFYQDPRKPNSGDFYLTDSDEPWPLRLILKVGPVIEPPEKEP